MAAIEGERKNSATRFVGTAKRGYGLAETLPAEEGIPTRKTLVKYWKALKGIQGSLKGEKGMFHTMWLSLALAVGDMATALLREVSYKTTTKISAMIGQFSSPGVDIKEIQNMKNLASQAVSYDDSG